jgi:hypothetical protein
MAHGQSLNSTVKSAPLKALRRRRKVPVCPTPGTAPRALEFREEPDFSPAWRVAARSCAILVLATWDAGSQPAR